MFGEATSFNQPLAAWDVSKVRSMQGMFYGATSFHQDISGWNVANVESMRSTSCELSGLKTTRRTAEKGAEKAPG